MKTTAATTETVSTYAQKIGMVLMTVAAVVGMLELPDHRESKIIVPGQAKFAFAEEEAGANPLRREKEDSAPHYISYGINQRTPGRTGKF